MILTERSEDDWSIKCIGGVGTPDSKKPDFPTQPLPGPSLNSAVLVATANWTRRRNPIGPPESRQRHLIAVTCYEFEVPVANGDYLPLLV